ncbi:MAG: hypothetical protein J4451_00585 [DPANN group archaeon]|nr:hypothetical protein [DPANN group archaeon]
MPQRYEELLFAARKEMSVADHLLYVTYPVVKESKFLLSIASKIATSARLALQALLEYEKMNNSIMDYPQSFVSQMSLYKRVIEPKYRLDSTFHRLMQRLFEIYQSNKSSVVKFKRGDSYILASKDYTLSVLDYETVKKYANVTKKFISSVDEISKVANVSDQPS